MKFYLSSYKLGNETERLKMLIPHNKIGYIPNALDFSKADLERKKRHIEKDTAALRELGVGTEVIDLRDYFGKDDELEKKIRGLRAIFISGGNVFVLRQAMKLSGLDHILQKFKDKEDFLYAGYSAAGCVLFSDLNAYAIVDDPTDTPYEDQKEVIWEGLGLIDFAFMPHYKSDHPESVDIDKEVEFCEKNNIPYRTLHDGEVIII